MPPNRFESEVESFLEGSHGDRTHIKRADHPRLHHYAGRYSSPTSRRLRHTAPPSMSAWPLSVSTVCKTYQVGRATARPPSQEMGDLMAIGEENCKVSDDNRVHQGRRLHLHRRVVWPVRCFLMGGSRCLSLAAHHLRHCA